MNNVMDITGYGVKFMIGSSNPIINKESVTINI